MIISYSKIFPSLYIASTKNGDSKNVNKTVTTQNLANMSTVIYVNDSSNSANVSSTCVNLCPLLNLTFNIRDQRNFIVLLKK